MKYPVFDLHCDTAMAMVGEDFMATGQLYKNSLHIDLERASKLPGYAQCFACFTTPAEKLPAGMTVADVFERQLSVILREINGNDKYIRQAYSASEIEANRQKGKMSAILTIEGPAGFGYDPELLENLYQIGFRITTLGWNERTVLTGSNVTGGGLTEQGREYVREAQRLGMIVDVSHISNEGFWDIMDITQAPIIASHSNSHAICAHPRNLTDEMFLAICRTGGVAGFNCYKRFVGEDADMTAACRHILHFLELDPTGKHIALGGDLDGCDELVDGFGGVQGYPLLAQALEASGVPESTIMDIFWNNAMGVIGKCCL